jgi:enamine deaminase RidA (YjgF/YER057c/UK114 family)
MAVRSFEGGQAAPPTVASLEHQTGPSGVVRLDPGSPSHILYSAHVRTRTVQRAIGGGSMPGTARTQRQMSKSAEAARMGRTPMGSRFGEKVWHDPSVTDARPVELVRVAQLTDRAPYAYAAVATDVRRLVFTAGACPLDAQGETVAIGDVAAQAEQVMVNLQAALAVAGAELIDVVKTTIYVASRNRDDLVTAWNVVHQHFGTHDAPSTLLGVTVLGYPDQLVEVEAVAALR